MNGLRIDSEGRFRLDDVEFVIDMSPGNRRRSTTGSFTIVKSPPYLQIYEWLTRQIEPSGILELGIFQGGSYVFIDKLFRPRRMSAVDISPEPVAPLIEYMSHREGRFAHFGTSQAAVEVLRRVVHEDLENQLDLVIDDASHTYELTRQSFEILFPLLRPNGIYIIEDWSWAHHPAYQAPDAPFAERPALTNLLFEQIMLLACTQLVSEIVVRKPLYLIRKAAEASAVPGDFMDKLLARGRGLTLI